MISEPSYSKIKSRSLQTVASSEDSHLYSCVAMTSPLKQYDCNQPNLSATVPDVCGMSAAPSWFSRPALEHLPTTGSEHRSVWRLDNGMGRFACGTHAHRVCARDTSITWQAPTRRAWLLAPWRRHTRSDSADKIMMCENMTAARALHVENTALKKKILSQRQQRFYSIYYKNIYAQ